ncbi:hypothetical protein DFH09DRAFT_1089239 [Mycena vulgaris]|nr:hypothetical protein DFH09DRAFT_1089239 [Mycena vulgaris]
MLLFESTILRDKDRTYRLSELDLLIKLRGASTKNDELENIGAFSGSLTTNSAEPSKRLDRLSPTTVTPWQRHGGIDTQFIWAPEEHVTRANSTSNAPVKTLRDRRCRLKALLEAAGKMALAKLLSVANIKPRGIRAYTRLFTFPGTPSTNPLSSATGASSTTSVMRTTTSKASRTRRTGASSTTSSATYASMPGFLAQPMLTSAPQFFFILQFDKDRRGHGTYPDCSEQSPLAVGSAGFIGVIVAGGVVLLVVVLGGILLSRSIRRNRSQRAPRTSTALTPNDPEMSYAASATQDQTPAGSQRRSDSVSSTVRPGAKNPSTIEQPAPGPSTALTQNDAEMSYAALETEYHAPAGSPHSSDNAASTMRPEEGNTRATEHIESHFLPTVSASPNFRARNDSDVLESHFIDSTVAPYTSGGLTFPAANTRTRNDSGAEESYFLADSPPPDRAQQAAMATRPQWTPGTAPLRPVRDLPPDSEPDGTTTYGNSRSSAADSDITRRPGRRTQYQHGQGASRSQNQEWQRHMRLWSSSVASENRPSTPDSDSTA